MSSIWLVCASAGRYAGVRAEIDRRDAGARLMRFTEPEGVPAAAEVLNRSASGIAISLEDLTGTESLVCGLARRGWKNAVLVMADAAESAQVARLLEAGATEVIAAGSTVPAVGANEACAQGEPHEPTPTALPAEDHGPKDDAPRGLGVPATLEPPGTPDLGKAAAGAANESEEAPPYSDDDVPEWEEERYACLMDDVPPWDVPAPRADGALTSGLPGEGEKGLEGADKSAANDQKSSSAPEGIGDSGLASASAVSPFDAAAKVGAVAGAGASASSSVPVEDFADANHSDTASTPGASATRAPLVVAISGRGGTGKTTLVAAMAHAAAVMGLRAAVLDLDLMFGNLHEVMGAQELLDLSILHGAAPGEETMSAVEQSAMRIAPGVTLWGPSLLPERAELLSAPVESLIEILRGEADVVFADTSTFWSDSVASAVSQCDRCLVVGQAQSAASAVRAVELAGRLGVAKTKMTSVFNRFGAAGNLEEQAMRFEMAVALRSRVRMPDGGDALCEMAAFGRMGEYMATESAFTKDVCALTCSMLKELGCDVSEWERAQVQREEQARGRSRVQLPWKRRQGARK